MPDDQPPIDFGPNKQIQSSEDPLDPIWLRAGFEDWDNPSAFVVQIEEVSYSSDRQATAYSPVARFDHGRPHDVFDPKEGLHLDIYRRDAPDHVYDTVDFNLVPSGEVDIVALFFRLFEALGDERNSELLIDYYRGSQSLINPSHIRFPDPIPPHSELD